MVKNTSENKLKKFLRHEVALQKMIHQNDTKERPQLYWMNILSTVQYIENLTILLTVSGKPGGRV